MDFIQIFTTLLGIAGIAGGATGYFAKSRGDTIISLQAKEIEYYKNRTTQIEKDLQSLTVERDTFKQQNQTLTRLAQGSPQLKRLAKEIRDLVSYLKQENDK